MTPRRRELREGGLTFDAVEVGPDDGPLVLLLHGFPQTSWCWRSVWGPLAEAGFHVVAPDQRGYSPGARPAEVEQYRLPALTGDALAMLDVLGADTAHVVGHDWGAAVAWQLAARSPDRVATVTSVCVPHPVPFLHALQSDDDQRRRSAYMREFARPGYDEQLLRDDAGPLRSVFRGAQDVVDVEHVVSRAREPGALAAWLRWYAGQRREDVADTPAVTVPTLYVWPTQDLALGATAARATGEFVTGPYRFEVLDGVTHWVPEQAAGRLAALLLEHLGPAGA